MLKIYRINFLSLSSPIRAYTLFGTICWAYKLAYGEEDLKKFLEQFKKDPLFLISSPFPIVKGYKDKKIEEYFLFPKPILPLSIQPEDNNEKKEDICIKKDRKKYKKAKYITEDFLKDFISGKIKKEKDLINSPEYKVCKSIIYKNEKEMDFYSNIKSDLLTKNVINRITFTSDNLYTEEGTFYDKQYFLVKFYDEDFKKKFDLLLRIIENLGLGKNKNIGWGKVKFIEESNKLSWLDEHIDNTSRFLTLSPIIPTKNIAINESFYEFEIYKSPVENSFSKYLMKQKVVYLKEGSFISSANDKYKGLLKQVVKDPEIYQYGLEFPIKVEL